MGVDDMGEHAERSKAELAQSMALRAIQQHLIENPPEEEVIEYYQNQGYEFKQANNPNTYPGYFYFDITNTVDQRAFALKLIELRNIIADSEGLYEITPDPLKDNENGYVVVEIPEHTGDPGILLRLRVERDPHYAFGRVNQVEFIPREFKKLPPIPPLPSPKNPS